MNSGNDADAPADDPGKVIADGVGNAYKVINRYISEGQRIAGQLGQSYSNLAMSSNPQEMQARWVQITSEMMASWMDLIGLATETFTALPTTATFGEADTSGGQSQVVFQVTTSRPIQCSAKTAAGAHEFELLDGEATPANGTSADRIAFSVQSSPADGSITIRFEVTEQAAGEYRANLANAATGKILGSILVDVL